jgi:hypothetical protein
MTFTQDLTCEIWLTVLVGLPSKGILTVYAAIEAGNPQPYPVNIFTFIRIHLFNYYVIYCRLEIRYLLTYIRVYGVSVTKKVTILKKPLWFYY